MPAWNTDPEFCTSAILRVSDQLLEPRGKCRENSSSNPCRSISTRFYCVHHGARTPTSQHAMLVSRRRRAICQKKDDQFRAFKDQERTTKLSHRQVKSAILNFHKRKRYSLRRCIRMRWTHSLSISLAKENRHSLYMARTIIDMHRPSLQHIFICFVSERMSCADVPVTVHKGPKRQLPWPSCGPHPLFACMGGLHAIAGCS